MDCRFEFVSGKRHPDLTWFVFDFVKDVDIDLTMKGHVEQVVKGIPQAVGSETWTVVVFDCFSRQELSFLDPVH